MYVIDLEQKNMLWYIPKKNYQVTYDEAEAQTLSIHIQSHSQETIVLRVESILETIFQNRVLPAAVILSYTWDTNTILEFSHNHFSNYQLNKEIQVSYILYNLVGKLVWIF